MADRVVPGPVENSASIREAVCVNTRKIFDSCRDKDCVDDLRVYPTVSSQSYIENALSIRPKRAELLYVDVSVEPVGFNRGYFFGDIKAFKQRHIFSVKVQFSKHFSRHIRHNRR